MHSAFSDTKLFTRSSLHHEVPLCRSSARLVKKQMPRTVKAIVRWLHDTSLLKAKCADRQGSGSEASLRPDAVSRSEAAHRLEGNSNRF
jgi:hypothetical protein